MRSIIVPAILTSVMVTGCASSGGAGSSPAGSRDIIRSEEIRAANVNTAYQAVRQLRPQFLTSRGVTSLRSPEPSTPVVYMDGVRFGPVSSLHSINASVVLMIEFLDANDATTRFGTGHTGGAILVVTRTGGE